MALGRFAAAAHRRFWSVPILARRRRTLRAAPRLNRTLAAQPVAVGDEHQERMDRSCVPGRVRVPSARMTRTTDCAAAWPLARPRQVLARTVRHLARDHATRQPRAMAAAMALKAPHCSRFPRSEEHTSELQSHSDLVCRLLLEKKKHI